MEKTDQPFALYQQIKHKIIHDIETATLKPGDRVPSETRLARAFNASRMTANRALKELSEENRIVRVQGVGTFVARPRPEAALLEIKSVSKEIEAWGGVHSAQVLCLEACTPSADIARKLSLTPDSKVFHVIVLHKDRGIAVQYSERYVNPAVAPGLLEQDFSVITPSDYLLGIAPVQEAEHVIEAVVPAPRIRQLLGIPAHLPCLSLSRRTWALDLPATCATLISPGDRYRLKGRFQAGVKYK